MVDIKIKKCLEAGCDLYPSFNYEGETSRLYCSQHKKNDMIDIAHKKCDVCKTTAYYGIPGFPISRCAKHKEAGMIIKPNKKCESEDCKNKASFGDMVPIHCEEHSLDNERNLLLRKCVYCHSIEICNKEGYCYEYCLNSKGYEKVKKSKELRFLTLLNNEIKLTPYSSDKIIDFSCNRKRPDRVYDCGTHFLVVENDEHQHKAYDCELNRMLLITQAIGMQTIFIRYNPDDFIEENGLKRKISQIEREKILVRWVNYLINQPATSQEEYLRCVYLFYNEHKQTTKNIENIKLPDNFFDYRLTYDKNNKI